MNIEVLKPEVRLRVMDLVAEAGIDVSDWANFKGGEEKAASNPKYCYEWSYENTGKELIVLNLWYDNLEYLDGDIVQRLNMRKVAKDVTSSAQSRRAIKMDFSLQKADRTGWPIRVVICDGVQREQKTDRTKSTAESRLLDSEIWHLRSYDYESGDCLLIRGQPSSKYVDQFEHIEVPEGEVKRRDATGQVFERSPQVRNYVLSRARGKCEWCGAKGFYTRAGSVYLETHHIQPLSENGNDNVSNVIALCPNHHREAHFGKDAESFKDELFRVVAKLIKSMRPTAKAAAD
jgi:5-methylcytosine-specific restriction protein A